MDCNKNSPERMNKIKMRAIENGFFELNLKSEKEICKKNVNIFQITKFAVTGNVQITIKPLVKSIFYPSQE